MPFLLLFLIFSSHPVVLTDSVTTTLRADQVDRCDFCAAAIPAQDSWNRLPQRLFSRLPAGARLEFGRNAPPTLLRVVLAASRPGRWWLVSTLRTPGRIKARLGHDSLGAFGSAYRFDRQPTGTLDLSIPLDLRAPAETLFLEVSEPLGPCDLAVRFVPDRQIAIHAQSNAFRSALMIGYMLAIFVVAIYLWLAVRERVFGWYVAYLACAIGWISTKRGVAFAWIWPDHPNWNPYASPSLAFLCLGFLSLFLVDLLDLRKNARRTTRVLGLATATMFLFSALSWFDFAVRSSLVRDAANADMLVLVGCLVGALLLRVLHRDRLAMQILFSFSPMALAIAFGALVEFGLGEQGPCVKSSLVAVAAILENALTTLVLVREVRRRDKERVVLERQFHQRVVERTDEHLGNLARELHDDLSQQVAALRMRLFGLSRARDDVGLDEAGRSVDELSRSLRRISHHIQPPLLEQGLLGRSLEQLCQELTSASSVEIAFLRTSDEPPVPRSGGIHLYRIVQEALANAIRHGRPSRVDVILDAEPGRLRLVVADDGAGFRPDGIEPGLGLWSIRSRAETLGGTLEIRSAPGEGTRIEIVVPLQGRPEDRP